ncbi:glycosyl transferase [Myxococcus virescens]|uniref:Glycosyl transferase n=2 Tax=Myxococcus virescens TaxID=83456 RepID=A0A511HLA1_9BACT|nr:glycosyl transferase [Myxococcus virescens]SDD22895.1 Glycosyltransferase involved in cell wall bisynthesis [Myxococcus virescens]
MKSTQARGRAVRRVLMTTDTVGGVWTYALELCRAFADAGVQVELATLGEPVTVPQAGEAAAVPGLRLHESTYRLEWMDAPWKDVRASGEWLLALEDALAPDVIHLNGYAHGALPWRAPSVVVAHSCVLSWWEAVLREPAPARYARYRREVQRGLRAVDRVVAPSAAMLGALERHYGPLLPPTCVIPNARRAGSFTAAPKELFVLAAGRLWDEAKNLSALEAVAPRLACPVRVAGELRHPGSGKVARARNTEPLGPLSPEALAAWMARAAIYAMPVRYEPFGLSALEAALSGCALVLGDIPSLREVWADAAVFVHPEDLDGLTRALRGLLDDGAHRERMAAKARARALTWNPRRMAEDYLRLYATLRAWPVRHPAGLALGAP